jgi:DNA-directed RNA polymerase specialized sigma24 family protein
MLGSLAEADDAVQDAWLRLSRSGAVVWKSRRLAHHDRRARA